VVLSMVPTLASDPRFPIHLFIRIPEYLRYIAHRPRFAPSSPWRVRSWVSLRLDVAGSFTTYLLCMATQKPEMTTPHKDRLALVQSAINVSLQEQNLRNGQFICGTVVLFCPFFCFRLIPSSASIRNNR
jgi:hypothetical protein